MKHLDLCLCHPSPRTYEDWMESWWTGIKWVLGHRGVVLVHCGTEYETHGHPYRDPGCGVANA